jgi:predicted heme/steroid binding protein
MKKFLLITIFFLVLGLTACQTEETEVPNPTEEELVELTIEELSYYNGKDGKPAYIAVQGYIYDVTNSSLWQNGAHNGFDAGQDLTDIIINQSPHGLSTLSRVPKIGILVTGVQ